MNKNLVNIDADKDCWINNNNTITRKYAVLVNFLPKLNQEIDSCSVGISNPWSNEMQNGIGVFLPQPIDCSTTVTVECMPGSSLIKQVIMMICYCFLYKNVCST